MSEGVRVVRAGMGGVGEKLGGTGRNSEGMGGVRVFSGGVSDRSCGSGGKRWDLEKERGRWDLVIREWVIMSFFWGGDNNKFLPKRRTFGIIHIFGKV